MKNSEFNITLKTMCGDDTTDDHEIISYVLNFASVEYPKALMVWILKMILENNMLEVD